MSYIVKHNIDQDVTIANTESGPRKVYYRGQYYEVHMHASRGWVAKDYESVTYMRHVHRTPARMWNEGLGEGLYYTGGGSYRYYSRRVDVATRTNGRTPTERPTPHTIHYNGRDYEAKPF